MEEIKSKKVKQREQERKWSGDLDSDKNVAELTELSLPDYTSSIASPILKRRD